jgi:hypothetical protein
MAGGGPTAHAHFLCADRSKGNRDTGIAVMGAGNLIQENKVYASGADGIEVTGDAASPNVLRQNAVGDKGRGNAGNGIHVRDDVGNGTPNAVEIERNTARSNGTP